jgi:nitrogen regulatory protein P-II 2
MKMVTAIVKPFKLDEVREALSGIGVQGHHGDGSQGLRPPERPHRAVPRRRVRGRFPAQGQDRSGSVDETMVDRVIEAIESAARTGKIGDGKVFVMTLEQVVRIRTGETGKEAL